MNTTENARYREEAEYDTTVEAAKKAAGIVRPADCLAYELRQFMAVYAKQIYNPETPGKAPEHLSANHPDYLQRFAEYQQAAQQQLTRVYELRGQELTEKLAADRQAAPPDEQLLLAHLLRESARRLLDGYADYLGWIGSGRLLGGSVIGMRIGTGISPTENPARWAKAMLARTNEGKVAYGTCYTDGRYAELDRSLIAAGAGAAELAHFRELLAAFHEREPAASKQVSQPVSQRAKNEARLHHLSASEVRQLLTGLGMGRLYNKPGEWAAAFRGLYVAGVLEGNAPAVTRWANEQGYTELGIKETIKKTWSGEWNEAGQFGNPEQSSVFSKTIDAANKLLVLNKLSHSNE